MGPTQHWPKVMTQLYVIVINRMQGPPLRGEDGAHLQKKSATPGQGVFCLIWLGAWSVEGLRGRRVALGPVLTAGLWWDLYAGQGAPGAKFILREQ